MAQESEATVARRALALRWGQLEEDGARVAGPDQAEKSFATEKSVNEGGPKKKNISSNRFVTATLTASPATARHSPFAA